MKRVKVSPLSRVAPTPPRPTMVVMGFPGTRSSAKAQSSRTSMPSRKPEPATRAGERPEEGQGVHVGAGGVEVEVAQRDLHVPESQPARLVGDRDQVAVDPLIAVAQMEVADVVRGPGGAERAGRQDATAGHAGKSGDTQRRSSRFT